MTDFLTVLIVFSIWGIIPSGTAPIILGGTLAGILLLGAAVCQIILNRQRVRVQNLHNRL